MKNGKIREFILSNSDNFDLIGRIAFICFVILSFLGPLIPLKWTMFTLIVTSFMIVIVSAILEGIAEKEVRKERISSLFKDIQDHQNCDERTDKDNCTIKEEKDEKSN